MPLFGHSDKNNVENQSGYPAGTTQMPGQTMSGQGTGIGHHHAAGIGAGTGPGQTMPGQTAPGQGTGIGHHNATGAGAGAGQFGQNNHTVVPAGNQSEYPVALSGGAQGAGHVPYRAEEAASNNYTQEQTAQLGQNNHHHTGTAGLGGAGVGATGTSTHTNGTGTHTNGTANGNTHSGGSATAKEIVGKIEHVVGSIVHSTALKEKGIMKEQQAASMKAQTHEISRAEALEQEAINARQRAAGHGANADIGKAVPAAPAGTYAGNSGAMPGVMPAGPNTGGHSLI